MLYSFFRIKLMMLQLLIHVRRYKYISIISISDTLITVHVA